LVQVAPLAANADDGDMAAEEPVEEPAEEASSQEPSSEELSEEQSEEPSEEASEEPAISGEADPEESKESEEAAEEPQVIALTGRFTLGHSELARLIEQRGMTYACNVTKQTTMLVRGGDQECQKWRAAQRYGVPVEGPARLAKLLGLDAI
jgi:NAD-dependent DNA ligase